MPKYNVKDIVLNESLEDRKKRLLKERNLTIALDHLCNATGRDIFVILPEKVEDRIPYLIKEIKITIKEFDKEIVSYQFVYKILDMNIPTTTKTITTDGGEEKARKLFFDDYDENNLELLDVRIV